MKNILKLIATFCLPLVVNAQTALYNNGAIIHIGSGATVYVKGELTNQSGSALSNNGELSITGNLTNNQVMSATGAGELKLLGASIQTIGGASPFFTQHVTFNNIGSTLNNTLKVFGESKFINGIISSSNPSNPLCYASTGSVSISNAPGNASHVNGYVVKEGTGPFDYPVGDGIQYQKVGVNLTANASGMRVKYNAGNAGAGTFTNGGTSTTPLIDYNNQEYWDIVPLSNATGNVTIYWDAYNNTSTPLFGLNRVAHKAGSSWLNEGTFATGNAGSGYVVSNNLTSWDKFTLGRIDQVGLPINVTLYLILYLQGYYDGGYTMRPALSNQGQPSASAITDTITVELHPALSPNTVVAQTKALLHTNGNVDCQFLVPAGNYYVVVKHRNHVETWSANPVAFTGAFAVNDFSYAANMAYGNNQVEIEPGLFAFYSGDINQDENADLLDLSILESDISAFQYGYEPTDLNGDGNVDLLDSPMLEANINAFVFSNHP